VVCHGEWRDCQTYHQIKQQHASSGLGQCVLFWHKPKNYGLERRIRLLFFERCLPAADGFVGVGNGGSDADESGKCKWI